MIHGQREGRKALTAGGQARPRHRGLRRVVVRIIVAAPGRRSDPGDHPPRCPSTRFPRRGSPTPVHSVSLVATSRIVRSRPERLPSDALRCTTALHSPALPQHRPAMKMPALLARHAMFDRGRRHVRRLATEAIPTACPSSRTRAVRLGGMARQTNPAPHPAKCGRCADRERNQGPGQTPVPGPERPRTASGQRP